MISLLSQLGELRWDLVVIVSSLNRTLPISSSIIVRLPQKGFCG